MQDIVKKLNAIRYNIKAETVINTLLSNGYSQDNIIVQNKSSHKKNWDNDILNCELKGGKICFNLSRDGLFDALPQYLFLLPVEDHNMTGDQKEKIHKFNKQQRVHANILLSPIEQGVFEKRVDLEQFENEVIFQLNAYSPDSLAEFYKIDGAMPPDARAKLIKLLPLLYSIAGDIPLTAKCLEYFLEVPVAFEIMDVPVSLHPAEKIASGGLGAESCGEDMITHGDLDESVPTILFSIGPIDGSNVYKYLAGGGKRNLVNTFCDYFIPLEYNVDLRFDIKEDDAMFSLDNSFLGFNSSTT